ncbi:unnamed protein product [Rotaria magnacalcarata]
MVLIVDQISKARIADIHWGAASTSTVIDNPTAGTVTATNLAITEIGMYVLSMAITSSNNQYSILLISHAILVKENTNNSTLQTFIDFPTTYITYNADYDSMVSSGTLNIAGAVTYDYLVLIVKLPIVSEILFTKGFSFTVGDVLYTSNSSSSSSSGGKNAGLIAGITVGVVAGVALIAGGVLLTVKIFMVPTGQPFINNGPDDATAVLTEPEPTNGNTANSSTSKTAPNNNTNRAHSSLPTNSNGQRPVAGLSTASATNLFLSSPVTTVSAPNVMPSFELLNLEHH